MLITKVSSIVNLYFRLSFKILYREIHIKDRMPPIIVFRNFRWVARPVKIKIIISVFKHLSTESVIYSKRCRWTQMLIFKNFKRLITVMQKPSSSSGSPKHTFQAIICYFQISWIKSYCRTIMSSLSIRNNLGRTIHRYRQRLPIQSFSHTKTVTINFSLWQTHKAPLLSESTRETSRKILKKEGFNRQIWLLNMSLKQSLASCFLRWKIIQWMAKEWTLIETRQGLTHKQKPDKRMCNSLPKTIGKALLIDQKHLKQEIIHSQGVRSK